MWALEFAQPNDIRGCSYWIDQLLEGPISYTCAYFPLRSSILTSLRAEQNEVICAVCDCVNAVFPVCADLRAHVCTCDVGGCGSEGVCL